MKKLLLVALLLVFAGCEGCSREVRIIHDKSDPDRAMGIVVRPVPIPDLPPMPPCPPIPLSDLQQLIEDHHYLMRC